MTIRTGNHEVQESYEYHGNTAIEHIRLHNGCVARDWIIFDSADEAVAFFNERCVS